MPDRAGESVETREIRHCPQGGSKSAGDASMQQAGPQGAAPSRGKEVSCMEVSDAWTRPPADAGGQCRERIISSRRHLMAAERGTGGNTGGIGLGGILVIVGIILMIVWSFWLGLIVTLVGLVAFGGFAKGKWY
jgi:hypothetical protein